MHPNAQGDKGERGDKGDRGPVGEQGPKVSWPPPNRVAICYSFCKHLTTLLEINTLSIALPHTYSLTQHVYVHTGR